MANRNDADDSTGMTWVVAFTNPRREATVQKMLKARALKNWLPVMTVTRRRSKTRRPLFPRYVFVGLDEGQTLFDLRGTPGLESIVRVAGRPYEVAPGILTGLREAEAAGVYDFTDERLAEREAEAAAGRRSEKIQALQSGMRVKVIVGPFASFAGVVDTLLLPDRVAVVVNIFGSRHPVPMRIDDVEPLPAARR